MLDAGLKALHLFGAVIWMGSAIGMAVLAALATDERAKVAELARRVVKKVANPAMILAWLGGLSLLAHGWSGYARAGWMHGKLLLVFIAAGMTGALGAKLRKLAEGEDVKVKGLAIALVVVLVLVLVMIELGPHLMPARTD